MRPLNDTTGNRKCQTFFCEKTGKNDEKTAVCGHVRAKCRLCRRIRGEAPSETTLRTGGFEKPLKHRFEKTFGKHLTNTRAPAIICTASGRLAQLVEHPLDVRKVAGSSPTSSTRRVEQKRCCPKKPRKFLGFLHVWGSKKYRVFP